MPENKALQDTIAYSLYMVKKHFQKWRNSEGYASNILLPSAYEEALSYGYEFYPEFQLSSRILRPLEAFGLLQRRELQSEDKRMPRYEYKLAPLFDQFIQFNP